MAIPKVTPKRFTHFVVLREEKEKLPPDDPRVAFEFHVTNQPPKKEDLIELPRPRGNSDVTRFRVVEVRRMPEEFARKISNLEKLIASKGAPTVKGLTYFGYIEYDL